MTDEQKSELQKHAQADAAGVVSHTSSGQPIPADTRLMMAGLAKSNAEARATEPTQGDAP